MHNQAHHRTQDKQIQTVLSQGVSGVSGTKIEKKEKFRRKESQAKVAGVGKDAPGKDKTWSVTRAEQSMVCFSFC